MLIGILIAIFIIYLLISFFCHKIKKIAEIISVVFRFCVGGMISMMIYSFLGIQFSNQWWLLLFTVLGAAIIFALIYLLAANFRLIGYSINYFVNSFLVLIVASILGQTHSVHFAVYIVILFLLPRLFWISDRKSTASEYSHTEYDGWNDIITEYRTIKSLDWWANSDTSWKWIPFQIVLSSLFYWIGTITAVALYPIEETWLFIVFSVLAIAINVVFDLFAFRKIEEKLC